MLLQTMGAGDGLEPAGHLDVQILILEVSCTTVQIIWMYVQTFLLEVRCTNVQIIRMIILLYKFSCLR